MAFFRRGGAEHAEKLVAKGKVEAAIKEFKKLLEDHANDTNLLNRVGDLYVRLSKPEEAAEYYRRTAESYAVEFLGSREGLELNKAFARITDPRVRRSIVDLVRAFAGEVASE